MPNNVVKEDEELLNIIKSLRPNEQAILRSQLKDLQQHDENQAISETENQEKTEFVKRLVGKTYSKNEQIQLRIEALVKLFKYRRELLEDSLTTTQVGNMLGVTRQAPYERYKAGTLLAVCDNGEYRFPLWQFDPKGANGVIDGLPEILKALLISDFAKLSWLTSPNPYFEGETPINLLKKGEKERVLNEAVGVGVGY